MNRPARFQVILDTETLKKLEYLKLKAGTPRSQVVRNLIKAMYAVEHDNRPICADLQRCLVPQMKQSQFDPGGEKEGGEG